MTMPFIDLQSQRRRLGDRIDSAIVGVLEHGQFIMGPEVAELEAALSQFSGAEHVVTCSSGTDALWLALRALGVGAGDAVFVPTLTFVATAEAVVLTGATPVMVDVDSDTFNLDATSLGDAIDATSAGGGPAPRAVIAVDLYGQPADYDAIAKVTEAHDLRLVCDSAQSFGASFHGRRVGTIGDITTTSFFPAKPLGCYGDGGAVLCGDPDLAATMRSLRIHGGGADKFDNVRVGINGRLDTIQAAILIEKLSIFPDELERRDRIARRYTELLADVATTPSVIENAVSAWAQYTIQIADRDHVVETLTAAGVPTAVHGRTPMHKQKAYADFPTAPGGLPMAEDLSERILSLPMHPYVDAESQDRVVEVLTHALGS